MRLYRFSNADTDAVVVTDGIKGQERVFITETTRFNAVGTTIDEATSKDNFGKLGFKWMVGETVMHQEMLAFAAANSLTLEVQQENIKTVITNK